MREATAISVVRLLSNAGAKIAVYDPKAYREAKIYFKDLEIEYCESKYDTLTGADAMALLTEWSEFRSPDFEEMKARMKNPVIFDGRNQYSRQALEAAGFEYFEIGVKNPRLAQN